MQAFRSVAAWQKAHELTLDIFRITEPFPRSEAFGLSSTMRRWSSSIAMKIAEGCGRDDNAEFYRCLQQARGLSVELEYQLLLAHDLQFIETPAYEALQGQVIEVRKMLSGFMKSVKSEMV